MTDVVCAYRHNLIACWPRAALHAPRYRPLCVLFSVRPALVPLFAPTHPDIEDRHHEARSWASVGAIVASVCCGGGFPGRSQPGRGRPLRSQNLVPLLNRVLFAPSLAPIRGLRGLFLRDVVRPPWCFRRIFSAPLLRSSHPSKALEVLSPKLSGFVAFSFSPSLEGPSKNWPQKLFGAKRRDRRQAHDLEVEQHHTEWSQHDQHLGAQWHGTQTSRTRRHTQENDCGLSPQ